jgi:hypothetical protein
MSHITRIGIDTSKAVFTLHCVDDTGRAVLCTNFRRAQSCCMDPELALPASSCRRRIPILIRDRHMPFKANAARRHHIPRQTRKVTNWAAYNASLRQRGSLTIWFSEEAIAGSVKNLGLRCELDCLLCQTVIKNRSPNLKHAMSPLRRPAHLPSLVHSCIDQLIDRALGP